MGFWTGKEPLKCGDEELLVVETNTAPPVLCTFCCCPPVGIDFLCFEKRFAMSPDSIRFDSIDLCWTYLVDYNMGTGVGAERPNKIKWAGPAAAAAGRQDSRRAAPLVAAASSPAVSSLEVKTQEKK